MRKKIDITNSQQVLQYGSACQKKIGDFSEAALAKVSTKDLGEVGDMITNLIGELKSFDANEEQQKGILGFFKKKGDQLDNLKTKYNKAETNVENIQSMLEGHQVQLLKDIAMLDKMYELNMAYFKELSMYILAGKKEAGRGACQRAAEGHGQGKGFRSAGGRTGRPRLGRPVRALRKEALRPRTDPEHQPPDGPPRSVCSRTTTP